MAMTTMWYLLFILLRLLTSCLYSLIGNVCGLGRDPRSSVRPTGSLSPSEACSRGVLEAIQFPIHSGCGCLDPGIPSTHGQQRGEQQVPTHAPRAVHLIILRHVKLTSDPVSPWEQMEFEVIVRGIYTLKAQNIHKTYYIVRFVWLAWSLPRLAGLLLSETGRLRCYCR